MLQEDSVSRKKVAWRGSLNFLAVTSLGIFLSASATAQAKAPGSATEGLQVASSEGTSTSHSPANHQGKDAYLIGPGDELAINVWQNPDISRTMPVRPDGHISLPLIGEVQAAGMSTAQLRDILTAKLTSYISRPEVSVTVQEIKSRTFNILGRVIKSGEYELTKPTTVLDAIAMAGGFQDFARVKKIYILRPTVGGSPAILPFNYKDVIKGKSPSQNVKLQPGDTVVVP